MGRAPCCDKANVKKGPWSPEEDAKLKHFIQTNGTGGNWITLPTKAGLRRCGKSCRLRWINYLRPDIKHGSFTEEEEKTIIDFHGKVGSRWSLIAAQLPGRTDNDIKNYWNTRLKKKLAEKGMNSSLCHQQQRGYHMRGAAVPMFAGCHLSQDAPATIRQAQIPKDLLMDHHQTGHYFDQQQRYNATQQTIQQGRSATLFHPGLHMEQWQSQQKQQMLSVKNELVNEQLPDQRLRKIESELISDIMGTNVINPMTSPLGLPPNVDLMHHHSPTSPCSNSNWSSDRSLNQLDDTTSYSDNYICNSYGDPPPLVDARALLTTNVLSSLPQQPLTNVRPPLQKEDSASSVSVTSGRFGYGDFADLTPFSDQTAYFSDTPPIDRQVVKEEMCTDLATVGTDFGSPTPQRALFAGNRNWPTCREIGPRLSAAYQAQMPPSHTLDPVFSEPLLVYGTNQYIST